MSSSIRLMLFTFGWFTVFAQTAAPPAKPQGQARRGPPDMASLVKPLEESGFKPIFDGKSMAGWEGDPALWRVEDGALVGQTTAANPIKTNSFAIWRGGSPGDFELKLQYRLTGHNSGVQYRSVELPDPKWAMKGYQADIDGQQTYTGQIYEERLRGFIALRGQASYVATGAKPGVIGSFGTSDELKALIKNDDWNDVHIIARGNTILQIFNGRVMSAVIDDDTANRKLDGLIGIQLHVGPPMKIEVRNIRLKTF